MSAGLPSGTLTFLFTDIEDSTRHLRTLRGRYGELIAAHAELVRAAIDRFGGREIDTQGDAFFAVFSRARDAVAAAAALQFGFHSHRWPEGAELRVRIGIHTGEPELAGDRYFGLDIHLAARICATARGGETLLSALSASLVRDQLPEGTALVVRGPAELKGFAEPEVLYRLVIGALPEIDEPGRFDPSGQERVLPFGGSHEELARWVTTAAERRSPSTDSSGPVAVVGSSEADLEALVPFARLLARAQGADLVLAAVGSPDERLPADALAPLRGRLAAGGTDVRVAAFRTADPGGAVAKLLRHEGASRVVADAFGLVDGSSPVAGAVLAEVGSEVLLHVPRGDPETAELLVPFSGSDHDWAALELATTLAHCSGARIRIAGIERGPGGSDDASRLLATASLVAQQLTAVVPEPLLLPPGVEAVLEAAVDAHIVTGVPPTFHDRGLGTTRAELATRAKGPVTLVRAGAGRSRREEGVTRFSWTLTTADLGA